MSDDVFPANYLAFGDLYDVAIAEPIQSGYNRLVAVTGFASAAFVQHILEEHEGISIELIIGMARASGIPEADHRVYSTLTGQENSRLTCRYYIGDVPVHAKMYVWSEDKTPGIGIVGSPNLSWHGFERYLEVAVRADATQILETYYELLDDSLEVGSPSVPNEVTLIRPSEENGHKIQAAHGSLGLLGGDLEQVTLSLLAADGAIHRRAGLNWGQREGRDPDQAYIPVPADVHREYVDFFPQRGHRFLLVCDDGEVLVATIAQQNRKAIETPDDNSRLGRYLRKRLGVPQGEFVLRENLEAYGRKDVVITKIDNDLFLMDFSM